MAELLFWPALLAYSEAAIAYAGELRRPGLPGRLATWGVRLGWLAQTLLLGVQVLRADGFAWSTWAGSLNLFVWLVVSAYLIWGCNRRFRLLGLAVVPLAAVLLAVAHAAGGTELGATAPTSSLFLFLHVGLVLIGLAGFTLAAGLSALYLWQERRLKRREAGILRRAAPPLASLEELAARTIAVSLGALGLGVLIGVARLRQRDEGIDALMAVTLATCGVYLAFLVLRYGRGWRGRRAASLAVAGSGLVLLVWVGLPLGHFS